MTEKKEAVKQLEIESIEHSANEDNIMERMRYNIIVSKCSCYDKTDGSKTKKGQNKTVFLDGRVSFDRPLNSTTDRPL